MSRLMDLVAGEASAILLVIGLDDLASLDDRGRFPAHLALGSGLDPTWLDLFAEAVRTVERVDPTWVTAVAMIPEHDLGAIAGRWIELVEDELGGLPREEKPWIRDLAGRLVTFCQAADRAPDVLFAWSLR
jgi:hypothetical protein